MLWDIATNRILATLTGHEDMIDALALSPDNRYALSGSRDKTVRLWDLRRERAVAVFTGHRKAIEALAFSADRKYVLSGSRDNTAKLWDVDAQKEIHSFPHDCPVTFVRFTPDGRYALSGDDDGAIRYLGYSKRTGSEGAGKPGVQCLFGCVVFRRPLSPDRLVRRAGADSGIPPRDNCSKPLTPIAVR